MNDEFFDGSGPVFIMIGGEGEENPIWMKNGQWINYAKIFVILTNNIITSFKFYILLNSLNSYRKLYVLWSSIDFMAKVDQLGKTFK